VIRTLEEIRDERGDSLHAFALMVTGAIFPGALAKVIGAAIQERVDELMTQMEKDYPGGGVEVTGLMLRVETVGAYLSAGLPNSSLTPRRGKKEIHPDDFVCSICGGGYIPEVIGMFAGKRYIHTCGD